VILAIITCTDRCGYALFVSPRQELDPFRNGYSSAGPKKGRTDASSWLGETSKYRACTESTVESHWFVRLRMLLPVLPPSVWFFLARREEKNKAERLRKKGGGYYPDLAGGFTRGEL